MRVTCISASNVISSLDNSTSYKVCELISDIVKDKFDFNQDVEIIKLVDHKLQPCELCGDCAGIEKCKYEDGFNQIYEKIINSDILFIVVPHYSPIPSKLMIILEKINEVIYGSYLLNNKYIPKSKNIKVGIIGHGGMIESDKVLKYYHDNLITPIAKSLKNLNFRIINHSDDFPNGVPFGVKNQESLNYSKGILFPIIFHDYDLIRNRITPLIKNITKSK